MATPRTLLVRYCCAAVGLCTLRDRLPLRQYGRHRLTCTTAVVVYSMTLALPQQSWPRQRSSRVGVVCPDASVKRSKRAGREALEWCGTDRSGTSYTHIYLPRAHHLLCASKRMSLMIYVPPSQHKAHLVYIRAQTQSVVQSD